MKLKVILLVGSLLTLAAACNTVQQNPMNKQIVTKPTLEVQTRTDGGICLDKENASKLGAYIQQLEEANK